MLPGSFARLLTSAAFLLLWMIRTEASLASESGRYEPAGSSSTDAGRTIWLANCETCHGYGIAGAPIPMRPDDWRLRLEKRREVLYSHALLGFYGEDDTWMPPRGGNADLDDDEVRAAVDYMTELARFHLQQNDTTKENEQ